jgi:hypothetical protein
MMRLLKFVPLFALPFLFLGATCVTSVEQKGPAGPWVGEVTNTGADVGRFSVAAQIIGSDGHEVYSPSVSTCPPVLSPGQVGAFELAVPTQVLSYPTTKLPLNLASSPVASSDQLLPDTSVTPSGLSARLVQKYPEHNALIAQISNDSWNDYSPISVCANIRDSSGHILAVGTGDLFPSFLGPQESHDIVVSFRSLPDGTLEFFVSASLNSGQTQALDPSALKISTTRVVQTDHGRELQGVGEVNNDSDMNLLATWFQVRLASSPTVVETDLVDTWDSGFMGAGVLLAGQKAPISFTLPLDNTDSTSVEVVGIEGRPFNTDLLHLPVKNVTKQRLSGSSIQVGATLSNPTPDGLQVSFICFNLRGKNDLLVGTSCRSGDWIEPNGSLTVSQTVTNLAPMSTVEVVAYGRPGPKVVPPS